MQNPHVKYLKTKNDFHLFYYEQGGIFWRHYKGDGWSSPKKVIERSTPYFSLCHYRDTAHLLYSNSDGRLFLASSQDFQEWEHRSMAEELHTREQTRFFLLPTENTFHMIWHMPTESTHTDALVYSAFREGK